MDKGDQFIVMLDVNVDLATNEDGFKEIIEKNNLKELMMSKHSHLTPPPTRTRGTHKNDVIFGTPELEASHLISAMPVEKHVAEKASHHGP